MPAKCRQQQVGSSVNGTRGRLSEISHPVPVFLQCLETDRSVVVSLVLVFFFFYKGKRKRVRERIVLTYSKRYIVGECVSSFILREVRSIRSKLII